MPSTFAVPLWKLPAVAIARREMMYPVRRIHCVGRNYAEHTREMGLDPNKEAPFFFAKPADAVVPSGSTIAYPPATSNFAHEVELVVAIGRRGRSIARDAALEHVYGYAIGLDLTRRDLQLAARERGRPWESGKAFDASAPISAIHDARDIGHPHTGRIWLAVNGELRQQADLGQLLWPVPDIIAFLSELTTLEPGDLIFTGTPAGVGPLNPGDRIDAGIQGVDDITIRIAPMSDEPNVGSTPTAG